jgi:hypothetical protein
MKKATLDKVYTKCALAQQVTLCTKCVKETVTGDGAMK